MIGYLIRLLVALDQLANTILLGSPDETISSRVGRAALRGNWIALRCECAINALFFWDSDHCRRRIEWDEASG